MENSVSNAFLLMVVGMSTVFFILFLVVKGGNLLIKLVNKIDIENADLPFTNLKVENTNPSKIAAIHAAIEVYTHGRGKIENIQKK